MPVNLIYVPQMKNVADFYRQSSFYQGENIFSLNEYKSKDIKGSPLFIGRNGFHHQQDLEHISLIKTKDMIPDGNLVTLVLSDKHSDYSNRIIIKEEEFDYEDAECWCWVSIGLSLGLYSNVLMVGVDGNCVSPNIEKLKKGSPLSPNIMKGLDKIEIYPVGNLNVEDEFYLEFEHLLKANKSVKSYTVVEDGKYVVITFKPFNQVQYQSAKKVIVTSADLDILDKTEMEVDLSSQGGIKTEGLLSIIYKLPRKVKATMVSGFTEVESKINEKALINMAKILKAYSTVMSQSPLSRF